MHTIDEIKKYMKANKITQVELAERANIPLQTIRHIFCGHVQNPRIDTMQAIENALGLNKKAEGNTQPQSIENLIAHLKELPPEKQHELIPVVEHLINAVKK